MSTVAFLVTKAVDPTGEAPTGSYDELRDVTMFDGTPLALVPTGRARTQTFTNVAREEPDADPSEGTLSYTIAAGRSVMRTQTFTKASGEAPDTDPHQMDARGEYIWLMGSLGRFDDEIDVSVDPRTGEPVCLIRGTIGARANDYPS